MNLQQLLSNPFSNRKILTHLIRCKAQIRLDHGKILYPQQCCDSEWNHESVAGQTTHHNAQSHYADGSRARDTSIHGGSVHHQKMMVASPSCRGLLLARDRSSRRWGVRKINHAEKGEKTLMSLAPYGGSIERKQDLCRGHELSDEDG
jgi:hypothetical protein